MKEVNCPYCGEKAEYVDSKIIYGISYGMVYLCADCDAYVGVHKGTDTPLGRLANAELRKAKIAAHAAFDPVWKQKMKEHKLPRWRARGTGYKWLAGRLGIDPKDCHIGMFDVAMCKKVVGVCSE